MCNFRYEGDPSKLIELIEVSLQGEDVDEANLNTSLIDKLNSYLNVNTEQFVKSFFDAISSTVSNLFSYLKLIQFILL